MTLLYAARDKQLIAIYNKLLITMAERIKIRNEMASIGMRVNAGYNRRGSK